MSPGGGKEIKVKATEKQSATEKESDVKVAEEQYTEKAKETREEIQLWE